MKKCMISIVLGCLMVMSVSGAAMAASAEPDALALSGVEVSSLAPVVMDGATQQGNWECRGRYHFRCRQGNQFCELDH